MTTRTTTALLAAVLSLAALPVLAQDAPPPPPPGGPFPDFATFDADGDGRITREEVAAARRAAIQGLDANGDGMLTVEEITTFRMAREQARIQEQVTRLMTERDLNGDGRLGADELIGGPGFDGPGLMGMPPRMVERIFVRIDADGDGAITRPEADAARERMARAHDRADDGGRDRGRDEGRDRGPRHGPGRDHGPDRDRGDDRGPGRPFWHSDDN